MWENVLLPSLEMVTYENKLANVVGPEGIQAKGA